MAVEGRLDTPVPKSPIATTAYAQPCVQCARCPFTQLKKPLSSWLSARQHNLYSYTASHVRRLASLPGLVRRAGRLIHRLRVVFRAARVHGPGRGRRRRRRIISPRCRVCRFDAGFSSRRPPPRSRATYSPCTRCRSGTSSPMRSRPSSRSRKGVATKYGNLDR